MGTITASSPVRAVTLILFFAGLCTAQPGNPCYAFLRSADVHVNCEGRSDQITRRHDIEGFAVSDERAALVYAFATPIRGANGSTVSAHTTSVVDLESDVTRTLADVRAPLSTCGGILPVADITGVYSSSTDLISGQTLSFDPYVRFRCSSDRHLVIGTTRNVRGELALGVPPRQTTFVTSGSTVYAFNISPNGDEVAYYEALQPLCVKALSGQATCAQRAIDLFDTPSVKNSGETLVSMATGQVCFYKSSFDFAPTPFAGASERTKDDCLGIGYWKPGLPSVQIIEPLGRSPQWISPATAELLRRWSAQQAEKSAK